MQERLFHYILQNDTQYESYSWCLEENIDKYKQE